MGSPHFVLYGHFGAGNIGNDSSLEATLSCLRDLQSQKTITCICTKPDVIAYRYGIQTLPFDASEIEQKSENVDKPSHRTIHFVRRIFDEIKFWLNQPIWFRSVNQFIIVGTGAVDDMAVRPWNAPYDLFKWCWAAKVAGTRIVFLSVGVGPIVNPISRLLMLSALRTADYRSYRETASLEYLHNVGFRISGDRLYPDLVFSLKVNDKNYVRHPIDSIKTIGLGVINYCGWQHDPSLGEPIYQNYIEKVKCFLVWLLEHSFKVRLIYGDTTDQKPIKDLLDYAMRLDRLGWRELIISEPIDCIDDLLNQISQSDIIVASRFHNIVCALMLGRPVISIGYHKKNDNLMAEMNLQDYCQNIELFTVDKLVAQFQSISSNISPISEYVRLKCEKYRRLLDNQYREIFSSTYT